MFFLYGKYEAPPSARKYPGWKLSMGGRRGMRGVVYLDISQLNFSNASRANSGDGALLRANFSRQR
jgi:hypothetical protein